MTHGAEQDAIRRVGKQLEESGVDALTRESMLFALAQSGRALVEGEDQVERLVQSSYGLTMGVSYFMAGSRQIVIDVATQIAEAKVNEHMAACRLKAGFSEVTKMKWSEVLKLTAVKQPWALALVIASIMVTLIAMGYGDRIFDLFTKHGGA